jgi:hypothetical protein
LIGGLVGVAVIVAILLAFILNNDKIKPEPEPPVLESYNPYKVDEDSIVKNLSTTQGNLISNLTKPLGSKLSASSPKKKDVDTASLPVGLNNEII